MGWYLSHDKSITFALWNFCIYLHQEKRLKALEARKLKQVLALELLEQTAVQGWGLEGKICPCKQSARGRPVLLEQVGTFWGKWAEKSRSLQFQLTFEMDGLKVEERVSGQPVSLVPKPASGLPATVIWHHLCHTMLLAISEIAGHAGKGSKKKGLPPMSVVAVYALYFTVLNFDEVLCVWMLPLSESGVGGGH